MIEDSEKKIDKGWNKDKIDIDMWDDKYTISEITGVSMYFNDIDAYYWGNLYVDGKCVGDYRTPDSLEIEKTFSHLKFDYGDEKEPFDWERGDL